MNSGDIRLAILDVLTETELLDQSRKGDLLAGRVNDIELASLGIDSMKVIDLCVGLEERFGREIAVEELIENPTVNRLADHLAKETA